MCDWFLHWHVDLSSNWRRTVINFITLFWAYICGEPTSWKVDFRCIFSTWRWREPKSQHPLVLIWCKYAAFQFHSTLSALLSSLPLIVQLFLKGPIVLHPADGPPMESELIISPCLLTRAMVMMMFGVIKMWWPVKDAFTTGRDNVTALSWKILIIF